MIIYHLTYLFVYKCVTSKSDTFVILALCSRFIIMSPCYLIKKHSFLTLKNNAFKEK